MKAALLFPLLVLSLAPGLRARAQESPHYQIGDHDLNSGGIPKDGVPLASPNFKITVGSFGQGLAATGVSSPSDQASAGFPPKTLTGAPMCALDCENKYPVRGLVGEELRFQAHATAIGCTGSPSFAWTFGDGGTSTDQDARHTYAAEGVFHWTLTVTVETQVCTKEGTTTITATPQCTLVCEAKYPTHGTVGVPARFQGAATATDCTGAPAFVWTFGDGGTSTEQDSYHTYSSEGVYSWTLTVTADDQTCTQEGTTTITAIPQCTLTCDWTVPAGGTAGATISFQASATATDCTGVPSFAWTFGDGGTSAEQNPSHTYAEAGSYAWTLSVTADDQICTREGSIQISSEPVPGDCDGNGEVSIGEMQQAINMFLGILTPGCSVDCNGTGDVSIGELQKVITAFLGLPSSC